MTTSLVSAGEPMEDDDPGGWDDQALMLRCRAGDQACFNQLYRRYKDSIYRFVFRQCSHEAIAKELVQDVWAGVYEARHGYQPKAKFTTWLYRIARNRIIDYYRKQDRELPVAPEHQVETPESHQAVSGPEILIQQNQEINCLLKSIFLLPEAQREAILMQWEMDFTIDDIADITGVNSETVKSRLRYARKKLKASLAEML